MNRRNALLSRASARLGLVALAAAAALLALRLFFPGALLSAATPLFRFSAYVSSSVGSFSAGFDNAAKLAVERDVLAQDNARLTVQDMVLTAKVADLEKLLGSMPPQAPGIIAGVLARPPETAYDTLILVAGSAEGVEPGNIAVAAGGVPIGIVTAVSTHAARVVLLSASGEATNAWLGSARIPITLEGTGAGGFEASLPRSASTTVGDLVYVSGPGALPVGEVRGASGDATSPFITLAIGGVVDIFSLPYVLIERAGPSTWPAGAPVATTTQSL